MKGVLKLHSGKHSPRKLSAEKTKDTPALIYFQDLINRARQERKGFVYIDVTDYVIFFLHRSKVSGIQRVVHSLIKYADLSCVSAGSDVIYCMTHPQSGCFANICPEILAELVEAVDNSDTQATISNIANQIIIESKFKDYIPLTRLDILLIPGGPWATTVQLNLYQAEKKRLGYACYCICYDLIPIDYPEFCATGLSDVFAATYAKLSRLTDGFISISEYSSESIRAYEEKNHIQRQFCMYKHWRLGDYDNDFQQCPASPPQEIVDVANKTGNSGFILMVSTIEPRKNQQSVLRAWRLAQELKADDNNEFPALVFAGKVGWNSDNLISQIECLQKKGQSIYLLEEISDDSMNWLYSHCLFSVMPSYVEGWGLSITESMMRGSVCITSNTSSMVEAASGIAPLFDAYSVRDLANLLTSFICDNALDAYQDKLKQYVPLSWQDSAKQFFFILANMHNDRQNSIRRGLAVRLYRDEKTHSVWNQESDARGFILHPKVLSGLLASDGCWKHLTETDLTLKPHLTESCIEFEACSGSLVVKVLLVDFSGGRLIPFANIHEEGRVISEDPRITELPNNHYIMYFYVPKSSREDTRRKLKIVFCDTKHRIGNGSTRSPAKIAPSEWFGIKHVKITLAEKQTA